MLLKIKLLGVLNEGDTCWERAQCAHLRSLTASASFCSGFFFSFTNSSLVGIVPPSHPILNSAARSETRKKYHSPCKSGASEIDSLWSVDSYSEGVEGEIGGLHLMEKIRHKFAFSSQPAQPRLQKRESRVMSKRWLVKRLLGASLCKE